MAAAAIALCHPAGGSLHPASHETIDKGMHFVHQEGQAVFKFASSQMAEVSARILERNGLTGDDIKLLIPHQANKRIIAACARRMKLPEDKVLINIDKYGNTTDATVPIGIWGSRGHEAHQPVATTSYSPQPEAATLGGAPSSSGPTDPWRPHSFFRVRPLSTWVWVKTCATPNRNRGRSVHLADRILDVPLKTFCFTGPKNLSGRPR